MHLANIYIYVCMILEKTIHEKLLRYMCYIFIVCGIHLACKIFNMTIFRVNCVKMNDV